MASTSKLFKGQFSVCLAYYDTRRGQAEGQEADKILGFFPPTAPATMQSSIVGLSQALTMFAGTFNKECPFHHMEAENNLWCMYHCEPDLWLLLVVSKTWAGSTTSQKSLQSYLTVLHSVLVLLHGTLTHQLEQDVSAHWVRKRLQPFLQEAAARLLRPETTDLAPLSCPLGMTEGIPILPLSTSAFTQLQALVNELLISNLFGSRAVTGVAVAYQQCLLWSSLKQSDTLALYHLANRTILPAVKAGHKHKTLRRPITTPGAPAAAGSSTSSSRSSSPATQAPAAASTGGGSASTYGQGLSSGSGRVGGGGLLGASAAAAAAAAGGGGGGFQHSLMHSGCWELQPAGWVVPLPGVGGAGGVVLSQTSGGTAGISRAGEGLPVSISLSSSGSSSLQGAPGTQNYPPPTAETNRGSAGGPGAATAAAGGGGGGGGGGSSTKAAAGQAAFTHVHNSSSSKCGHGGAGGGLHTGAAAADVIRFARVWLEGASEYCLLLPWHYGPLVVLLLLQDTPQAADPATAGVLLGLLQQGLPQLVHQLQGELPAKHLWHVPGLRYMYSDALCAATKASPLSKVATLAHPSLVLAADVRAAADLELAAQADPTTTGAVASEPSTSSSREAQQQQQQQQQGSGMSREHSQEGALSGAWSDWAAGVAMGDVEVVMRGGNDAWAVARHAAPGRQLCVVVEGDREVRSMAGVMAKVEQFCDLHVPGVFDGVSL